MKKFTKIFLGSIVIGLIVFNLNYSMVNSVKHKDISLGIINTAAAAGGEYFDEENKVCSCGAFVFRCEPVEEIASCNVSGQKFCSEVCD